MAENSQGPSHEKHGQLVKFRKSDQGLSHGFANLIAHEVRAAGQPVKAAETDLVATQYSGAKVGLKPIYDALIKRISTFGGDVELAPKKAYVSLRRRKQFANFQPSTKKRMDVGIKLKGAAPTDRLETSGSFNAMVSHRLRVTDRR